MRKTLVLLLLLGLSGCGVTDKLTGEKSESPKAEKRALNPADFAAPGGASSARMVDAEQLYVETMAEAQSQAAPSTPRVAPPASAPGQAYAVDAMVGQVNGRPIYASAVFDLIDAQLTAMGKQLPPARFQREAAKIIAQRVNQIVFEALALGDAERDLTEPERQGLTQILTQQREELIRKFGQGASVVADVRLRESRGRSLEQELENYRQTVIVRKYMQKTIMPRVSVSRKDIERYYRRHNDEFNPKPGKVFHMIRVGNEKDADRVDQLLAEGRSFLDVAADTELNTNNPEKQGEFITVEQGDKISRVEEIEKAAAPLNEGEYTERIKFGTGYIWIYLKKVHTGQGRSLAEVQGEIEGRIRAQRYAALTDQYRDELFKDGSYDSLELMVERLLDIAMNRYTTATGRL